MPAGSREPSHEGRAQTRTSTRGGARQRGSQVARIAAKLEAEILGGRYCPGQRLSETDLALSLDTSRTPVREAMRLLVGKGLLVARHGRGMTVPRLDPKHVSEVLAVRSCLECFALRLAIPRITNSELALLRSIFAAMEDARNRGDASAFEEHDESLHRAILDAAGSAVLVSVINGLSKQIRTMRGALLTLPGELAASQEFHTELIDAIATRNVERAVRLREGALEIDEQKLLMQLQKDYLINGKSLR